jgi:hypothetical protein
MWALLWLVDAAFVAGDLGRPRRAAARPRGAGPVAGPAAGPLAPAPPARGPRRARRRLRPRPSRGRARGDDGRPDGTPSSWPASRTPSSSSSRRCGIGRRPPSDVDARLGRAPALPIVTTRPGAGVPLRGPRDDARAATAQCSPGLDVAAGERRWLGTGRGFSPTSRSRWRTRRRGVGYTRAGCAARRPVRPAPDGTVFSPRVRPTCCWPLALVARRAEDALQQPRVADRANAACRRSGRCSCSRRDAAPRPAVPTGARRRGGGGDLRPPGGRAGRGARHARPAGRGRAAARRGGTGGRPERPGGGGGRARRGRVDRTARSPSTSCLSERTIESHVRNALLKLGLSRRAQLVAWRLSAAHR